MTSELPGDNANIIPLISPESKVFLTVIICGTANSLDPPTTQIGVFYMLLKAANAFDLSNSTKIDSSNKHDQFVMGFDGCGVTNGCMGTIFAAGLRSQARKVVEVVDSLLLTNHVTVNILGLSRGGIGAMYLCQMLAKKGSLLSVNVCLFDPVPGSLITTSKFCDPCKWYNANMCMDLTGCETLRSVLAIYPIEALPALAFHAPVFGNYPNSERCTVEEDVTLGCHQGALFHNGKLECKLSFHRIYSFLTSHGTRLCSDTVNDYLRQMMKVDSVQILENKCLKEVRQLLKSGRLPALVRWGHVSSGYVALRCNPEKSEFLNSHHAILEKQTLKGIDGDFCERTFVLLIDRDAFSWVPICLVLTFVTVVVSLVIYALLS